MKPQITIRRNISLLLILLMSFSLIHCKKDKDLTPEEAIVGNWKLKGLYYKEDGEREQEEELSSCTKSSTYIFDEDGYISFRPSSGCDDGDGIFTGDVSYEVNGNSITIDRETFDLEISGSNMTISFSDNDVTIRLVFVKK
ncbi:hypothetical protein DYBT9275_04970 [Dyadobacter sp. CECT 9275]|uniref:Lipocalin-like domain-containing protein n=1 Tax=Dyadobacter helix TaxID=2822344 RepID=A0A916JIV6_9BACT|nr:lipocalin family protein [Dyadobacter sp. CECT 9275]CAG5011539.1 hypothetical protein DYBT9275_04970 [Dyadobacter sp. CECT 9275]